MNRSKYLAFVVSSLCAVDADAAVKPTGANASTTQRSVAYACDGAVRATATYDTTSPGGGAVVAIGGHTLHFGSAISGSGARYETATGPHTIAPLEWWTKGRGATLSEPASGGRSNRLIATCQEVR